MNKLAIYILLISLISAGYYYGINYFVLNTGKGKPISTASLTPITNENGNIKVKIIHEFPLVNFSDSEVEITGIIFGKIYYRGKYKSEIKLSDFPDNDIFRIDIRKNGLHYVYGSKAGAEEIIDNPLELKITLFSSYSKEHLGWYKLEKIK